MIKDSVQLDRDAQKETDRKILSSPDAPIAANRADEPAAQTLKRISGWANYFDGGTVVGWAVDRDNLDRRFTIEIYVDDLFIGTVAADKPRSELQIGDCRYGFSFLLPPELQDGEMHGFSCKPIGVELPLKVKASTFRGDASLRPIIILEQATPSLISGKILNVSNVTDILIRIFSKESETAEFVFEPSLIKKTSMEYEFQIPNISNESFDIMATQNFYLTLDCDVLNCIATPLWSVAQLNWTRSGAVLSLQASDRFHVPECIVLNGTISNDEIAEAISIDRRNFVNNAFSIEIPPAFQSSGYTSTASIPMKGDEPLIVTRTFHGKPKDHLLNKDFADWRDSGPDRWDVPDRLQIERGARFKPTKRAKGPPNTLIVKGRFEDGPTTLLSQKIASSAFLDLWTVRLTLRGAPGVPIRLAVKGEDGRDMLVGSFETTTAWRTHCFDCRRDDADRRRPAKIELQLDGSSAPTGSFWVELDEIDLVSNAHGSLDDGDTDDRRIPSGNLVSNAEFNKWPSNGIPNPTLGRFEFAQGWRIDNEHAAAPVLALPLPLVMIDPNASYTECAVSISAPEVARSCRITAELSFPDISGAKALHLKFNAFSGSASEGVSGLRARPDRWSFIDRIFVLARAKADPNAETVVLDIARKLLLTRERKEISLNRQVDAVFSDLVKTATHDFLLVFEFRKPFLMTLDRVNARMEGFGVEIIPEPVELEDHNIAAQISRLKGCERWNAPEIVSAYDPPDERLQSGGRLKWGWDLRELGSVEIVICVHDALDETLACLQSLIGATTVPHTVLIVDDGSSVETASRLDAFARLHPWVRIHTNQTNLGYTRSADTGIRASRADWVVLLNSDTVVTAGWLEGLLEAAHARPQTAFVGPVSNAATYQSLPHLYDEAGKWATNELPAGWSADRMAAFVKEISLKAFPEVPLLNGFCTLMRRQTYLDVGGLDPDAFPTGYGEENDLCLRVGKAGFKLVVADHVYIYHAKSASFGSARRTELTKLGSKNLRDKHPDVDISALTRKFMTVSSLNFLREKAATI